MKERWSIKSTYGSKADTFQMSWLLHLPDAHPCWQDYFLALYDLSDREGEPTAYRAKPGVTHEFILFALDPEKPIRKDLPIEEQKLVRLEPANHAYQFSAQSHAEAAHRLQLAVNDLVSGILSPDTDYTVVWDALFSDGVTLKQSFALMVFGEPTINGLPN